VEFFLFTADPKAALQAERAGVDSVIVDWESTGKAERQGSHGLEINHDTPHDLRRIAQAVSIPVTVRLNALSPRTPAEIECALDNGADTLMLPMATNARQVAVFLQMVKKRAKTLIQIETQPLVDERRKLAELPWDYAYIGLNDLMLSRGSRSIWQAVLDGTVESIYRTLGHRAVGFGGVTIIGGGTPIPFTLLLHEMVRLGCRLSFLRRTFKKELLDRELTCEIEAIRAFLKASRERGLRAVAADHRAFLDHLDLIRTDHHAHPADVQLRRAQSRTPPPSPSPRPGAGNYSRPK